MSEDFLRRAKMALHDMQGRVEGGKLAMFQQTIDYAEALQDELDAARAEARAAMADAYRMGQEDERAAPNMLKALQLALELFEEGFVDFDKYGLDTDADIGKLYRAAIAKAEGRRMTGLDTRILAALSQANALTTAEIARDIDADTQAAQRALHALDDAGHVIMRNGFYCLSEVARDPENLDPYGPQNHPITRPGNVGHDT